MSATKRTSNANPTESKPFAETNLTLRRLGAPLLDLQMWCWGCDIRRREGNLLTAYGLERLPSSEPRYRSAYTCGLCDHCRLTLWAWGLWLADPQLGSLYLSRSQFRIRASTTACPHPNAWNERALPATCTPQTEAEWRSAYRLFAIACTWIAAYERWLESSTDANYREQVSASWLQRRAYPQFSQNGAIGAHWQTLAQLLDSVAAYAA